MRLAADPSTGPRKAAFRPRPARARRGLRSLASLVVVLVASLLGTTRPVIARSPLEAITPPNGAPVWVAAAEEVVRAEERAPAPRARITFLHGMCSDPYRSCAAVRTLADGRGALACPAGNGACGGAADWRGEGEEKAAHLDVSLGAAWAHLGASGEGRDVLVGFSRGAFVARDVAYARPGRFRALVLIGAATIPEAALLQRSGIRRVVLASGDFDPARRTMVRAAAELSARGVPARFVPLGPIGHALPKDVRGLLGVHLDWALGAEPG